MLEIAWQLNKDFPLEIHSYSLEGYDNWPDMRHIQYQSLIKRPIIFKYMSYHWQTWKNLSFGQDKKQIVQSTGTASLRSDVVQVQFIHHEWEEVKKRLQEEKVNGGRLKSLYHGWLSRYNLSLEQKIYTPDRHFIAISHGIKKELIKHFGIPAENISIIYHGVDIKSFCPFSEATDGASIRQRIRQEMGFKEDDIVFLHVGALNTRKGLFKTLEVLKILRDNGFEKVKFLAVGQGDQNRLNKTIRKLGIGDRVQLVSHSKQVRDFYWASDLFFFPTYYEPFGLVILEAMACGLPVATTTCAGAAELIEDRTSGILYERDTPAKEIVDQLNYFLKNPEQMKMMGEKARAIAVEHSWQQVGQSYRSFYSRYSNQKSH